METKLPFKFFLLIQTCFVLLFPLKAQQDYNYLVKYLPIVETVGSFQKSEILIDEPCEECLPTVTVLYQNQGSGDEGEDYSDLGQTISFTIVDCKGANEYLNSMLEVSTESQSHLIINKKYKGWKEKIENDFGIQECIYTYSVADRFLIQINGGKGDVFAEMDKIIESIDHEKLELVK